MMEDETIKEEKQVPEKPLDRMTVKDLREIAKDIPGVTGVHAMKKEELLVVVKEARGIKDEKPEKRRKKKTDKQAPSIKELKKKILGLREQRMRARNSRDRKKIDILHRRINRLKKQTRKVARG